MTHFNIVVSSYSFEEIIFVIAKHSSIHENTDMIKSIIFIYNIALVFVDLHTIISL